MTWYGENFNFGFQLLFLMYVKKKLGLGLTDLVLNLY